MSDKANAPKPQGFSPWTFLLMILLTLWVCQRPDPRGQVEQCGKHLHQIGVALEKFRLGSDDGLYPRTLEEAYKKGTFPACPAAGAESYRLGYKPSADLRSYSLACQGDSHQVAGLPSDYPRIAFGPHENETTSEEDPSPASSPSTASPSPLPAESPNPKVVSEKPKSSPTPVIAQPATPTPHP